MSYTLIGSERSPFVRICRMFMMKHGIDFQFRILNFVDSREDAEALAKESPINKVPILIDDGQKIYDSRVILNHLVKNHGLPTLSIEEQNLVSMIYSVLDAGIILFLMKKDGYDLNAPGFFLNRNRNRIENNLKAVTSWASGLDPQNPDHWSYPSMSLYSCLHWIESRAGLLRVSSHPDLAAFMSRFANAPGIRETHII